MRSPFVIPSSGQNGLSRFERRSSRRPPLDHRAAAARARVARRGPPCPHGGEDTRARAVVLRASTRRTRPRRRASGSTQMTSERADPRHLRHLGERRVGSLERCEQGAQALDLASEKPVPTFPAQRSTPASCTPTTSAPNPPRGGPDRACTRRSRPPASGAASASASRASGARAGSASRAAWRRRLRAPARAPRRAAPARRRTAARRGRPALASDELLEALPPLAERLVEERLGLELEQVEENENGVCRLPPAAARSASGRSSSSAQISPSSTASDERIARAAARASVAEPLRQVVAVTARERHLAAGHGDDRAKAVPLRLVDPALARGQRVRGGREHRLVPAPRRRARRPCAGAASSSGRRRARAGTSVHTPSRRSPCSRTVSPPLRFSSRSSYVPRSQISTVPAPYSPAGIVALEVGVLERVILDVHREMPLAASERNALRNRPARESAVRARAESRSGAASRACRWIDETGPLAAPAAALRTAPASSRDDACGGTRRGSPVDCRPKRNAFFTKRLQDAPFPCSDRITGRG